MPGGSTRNAILALRHLMEKYREGRQKLCCIFIDMEKVYGKGPRAEVWNCMRLKKLSQRYIRMLPDMCKVTVSQ